MSMGAMRHHHPSSSPFARAAGLYSIHGRQQRATMMGASGQWPRALLLFLVAASVSLSPADAIRGALFRTGRSVALSRFLDLGGPLPIKFGSDSEEDRLLSLASHPALMVDLRQLLEFSRRQKSAAGDESVVIRPIAAAGKEAKRGKAAAAAASVFGQQWKSPRLSAFLAMVRQQHQGDMASGAW